MSQIAKEKQLRAEENRKAAEILGAEITRASREKERLEREIAHSKEVHIFHTALPRQRLLQNVYLYQVNVMQKEAIAAEAKAREESAARAGGELSQLAGQHAREMANVMKDFAAEKRKLEAEREAIHKERQETIETTEQRIQQMKLEREKVAGLDFLRILPVLHIFFVYIVVCCYGLGLGRGDVAANAEQAG